MITGKSKIFFMDILFGYVLQIVCPQNRAWRLNKKFEIKEPRLTFRDSGTLAALIMVHLNAVLLSIIHQQ
jgi:hypothetical protein